MPTHNLPYLPSRSFLSKCHIVSRYTDMSFKYTRPETYCFPWAEFHGTHKCLTLLHTNLSYRISPKSGSTCKIEKNSFTPLSKYGVQWPVLWKLIRVIAHWWFVDTSCIEFHWNRSIIHAIEQNLIYSLLIERISLYRIARNVYLPSAVSLRLSVPNSTQPSKEIWKYEYKFFHILDHIMTVTRSIFTKLLMLDKCFK
jgi:hypothetical protein